MTILIQPIITEKALEKTDQGIYVFKVPKDFNKIQIKEKIEGDFKTKIEKVRIVNIKPKKVRFRRIIGYKKGWKKAIVTLKKGQKLEIYPVK